MGTPQIFAVVAARTCKSNDEKVCYSQHRQVSLRHHPAAPAGWTMCMGCLASQSFAGLCSLHSLKPRGIFLRYSMWCSHQIDIDEATERQVITTSQLHFLQKDLGRSPVEEQRRQNKFLHQVCSAEQMFHYKMASLESLQIQGGSSDSRGVSD